MCVIGTRCTTSVKLGGRKKKEDEEQRWNFDDFVVVEILNTIACVLVAWTWWVVCMCHDEARMCA